MAELAIRQWGVVSVEQLHALGLTSAALTRRVQAGRLHRLYRGVYAVGHDRLRREGRFLAAVFACGDGAVLSHLSAAVHWGLLGTEQAKVDVTARRGRRGVPGVRLHRSRVLDARDSTTHDGMPITGLARTLLDLAATLPAHRLERALAQAERLRIYDHRAITDVIARTNGHRGGAILARATALEPRLTRSDLEALFRSSSDGPAYPSRCRTTTSRCPTTAARRSTSTGRRIVSSSRPTDGRPTAPEPRSRPIVAKTWR